MSDESDMKQTRSNNDDGLGCLALILVIGLSLLMSFGVSGIYLNEPDGVPVFYPLLLITQYGPFQALLWSGITIIFLGLLFFAVKRGRTLGAVFAFLIGIFFLLFMGFGLGSGQAHIQPYQTLAYKNHVYHLVAVWDAGDRDLGSPSETYQVFECDTSGLICYRFQTPYSVELTDQMGHDYQFDTSGELFVDEAVQVLKLRVGTAVYLMLGTNRP
jgi:hypothetical protein